MTMELHPGSIDKLLRLVGGLRGPAGMMLRDLASFVVEWRNCVGGLDQDAHRGLLLPETAAFLRDEWGLIVEIEEPGSRLARMFRGDPRLFCVVRRTPEMAAARRAARARTAGRRPV
jgi:hypothetical protein